MIATLKLPKTIAIFANPVDPDEIYIYEPSHLHLQCLPLYKSYDLQHSTA